MVSHVLLCPSLLDLSLIAGEKILRNTRNNFRDPPSEGLYIQPSQRRMSARLFYFFIFDYVTGVLPRIVT